MSILILLYSYTIRLHGSYEALKYGTMMDGLSDLTGGIAESISLRQDPTASGRLLNSLLDMTTVVTCTVQPPNHHQVIALCTLNSWLSHTVTPWEL